MSIKDQLLAKINDHNAVVAIVGLGYVGLPLAVAFAEHGFPVIGIDVDARKVTSLNLGESYVQDIPSERLAAIVAGGNPASDGTPAAGSIPGDDRLRRTRILRRGDCLRAHAAQQDPRPGRALRHRGR